MRGFAITGIPNRETGIEEPQEKKPLENESSILHRNNERNTFSERIEKLVSSQWYVHAECPVLDLAEELKKENINIVGVTDFREKIVGIVTRQSLLNMMSRQFGREVLKTEKVESVMSTCRHFHRDANIFSVADMISHEMQLEEITYFVVKDSENKFKGIFSTNDMLIYLSSITRRDIELARIIQKGIVKEYQQYKEDSIELVCSSIMSQVVGGDFYSLQKLPDDKLLLSLCDVSGKGVAASLVTAFLFGMIHNYKFYDNLTNFVEELNRMFIQTFNLEKFVTGQFIIIDPQTGDLAVCDMGHPFAYIYRDGQFLPLFGESGNLPIGVTQDLNIQALQYQMIPGDIVMIVTDGITEQINSEGTLFSIGTFSPVISRYKNLTLNRIAVRMLEVFHHFRKKTPLHDDATFLLFRYSGHV